MSTGCGLDATNSNSLDQPSAKSTGTGTASAEQTALYQDYAQLLALALAQLPADSDPAQRAELASQLAEVQSLLGANNTNSSASASDGTESSQHALTAGNGCSAPAWSNVLLGILLATPATFFDDVCNYHDQCYTSGLATYGMSRLNCDDAWNGKMASKCDSTYPLSLRILLPVPYLALWTNCRATADIMYQAVRAKGESYYWSNVCIDGQKWPTSGDPGPGCNSYEVFDSSRTRVCVGVSGLHADGSYGDNFSGCGSTGCLGCKDVLTLYPNYFNNHTLCSSVTTCNGNYQRCGAACPTPTSADATAVPGQGETATAKNADGRMEVFVRGNDDNLYHNWQVTAGGAYSGWASLGAPAGKKLNGNIVVGTNTDGRLEVFGRASDNSLWHIYQNTGFASWSSWYSLGGTVRGRITGLQATDGHLEVYAKGSDNTLQRWNQAAGWTVTSLGGNLVDTVAVGTNADLRLEVFAKFTDNAIYHNWQMSAGGSWSGWASMGGQSTGEIAVGRNNDGRLEVFARFSDNALYHCSQGTAGSSWSAWASMSGANAVADKITLARNSDGRLELFFRTYGGLLAHAYQQNSGAWSGIERLGGYVAPVGIGAALNGDNRLDVYVGTGHVSQVSTGGWSAFAAL
jgi:hypothetical protein